MLELMATQAQASPLRPAKRSYLLIGGCIVIGIAGLIWFIRPRSTKAPVTAASAPSIWIKTADGVTLAADVKMPVGSDKVPAIILIHDFGADRHQWDQAVKIFSGKR